ncbi:hypothetical protein J7L87_05890 [bacterium]|nr:hypothetical protein [bacterium]
MEKEKERLKKAIDEFMEIYEKNQNKNLLSTYYSLQNWQLPEVPPVKINKGWHPSEMKSLSENIEKDLKEEDEYTKLAKKIEGLTAPLKLEQPFLPVIGTGFGTMTVATAFGIEIIKSPSNPDGLIKENIPLEKFDEFEVPDPGKDGLFPKLKEEIEFIKENTPEEIKISYPDMQGPFNTAHIILGTEIFYKIYDEKERIFHLLQLITDFMIRVYKVLPEWIGEERIFKWIGRTKRIAECSCNLISKEVYKEIVKPFDIQLVNFHGEIAIHPCSGKHVFEVTLEELPDVRFTECGIVENAVSGSTEVEYAIEKVKNKRIILSIGEELKEGKEEQTIRNHIEKLREHPFLVFNYTGMYWTEKDIPKIKELNGKMQEFYLKTVEKLR